ncbi:Beta-glucosidase [Tolypocladium paradoxum]|uniref:beta-glucosidase n=1 Tax=Tolypocladium paradoxum TaxID=94208 RepID=A0A2S4L6M3_9HYPO|nr:Beta-glucosidase [Tolypocladium paradoxum]
MFGLKSIAVLAASIAVLPGVRGQDVVLSDSYFFGQSEPVYPTPHGSGVGDWAKAYSKARTFVSRLTLDEKVNLTGGFRNLANGCGGNIPGVPRLGFAGLCLQDAGNGVRQTDYVNAYSSGVHIGASWNKDLTYRRAYQMGGEFRRKGASIALGPPMVGPLGRISRGGRNWEGFSNDPYHSGILAGISVQGIQEQGVISCTKHLVGNEQELHRNIEKDNQNNTILSSSSNIDDTTMHELYLWPFADALRAGSASVMCSYNRLNNSYACQNSKLLNGILKHELGFQGFVVSDWSAQHGGVASALAGLDMAMPFGATFWGNNLTQAVQNGTMPESQLDNMVTRIMAAWYHLGQDSPDYPPLGVGLVRNMLLPHAIVDARIPAARPVILQEAIEGHVLVKNINKALPLRTPRVLSLFGYDAVAPNFNTPNNTDWNIGVQSSSSRYYTCGFASTSSNTCPPPIPISPNGTMIMGGGSGAASAPYISAPFNAIQEKAIDDGTQLYWDFRNYDATGVVHAHSDAAIVFLNAAAGEGVDRPSLRDDFSDALVRNIAAQSNNTIVVIHNAGVRLVDQWIENPNVTAVIFAHLPGQDSGKALVDLLYGKVSPSGKLPYTVAKNESDYGVILNPRAETAPNGKFARFPQDDFTEGVYIDYRAFDAQGIKPRFEFGFGLTYTTFSFSGLGCRKANSRKLSTYPVGPIVPGGHDDLWDVVATVTAKVTNTGTVAAKEVAQLYIGIPAPGQPVRQLRGFEKVWIRPKETVNVEFKLKRRDLSVWDLNAQKWKLILDADFKIFVGSSSRDLPLTGALRL